METLRTILLVTHITLGFISLILFWIPGFTKKGSLLHKRAGKLYVRSMFVVLVSAALLSCTMLILGNWQPALFLAFLTLLTAQALWSGFRVLAEKRVSPGFVQKQLYLDLSIALFGGVLLYLWFAYGSVLFVIFGLLGLLAGSAGAFGKWHRKDTTNRMAEHFGGMIFSGGAAYTAFLAFGAQSIFPMVLDGFWAVLPWVLPTIVAVVAVQILKKKYATRLPQVN